MPALKTVLSSLLIGTATLPYVDLAVAKAQTVSQPGYSRTTQCFRDECREEYVPGTKDKPGYVRSWTEKVEIACANKPSQIPAKEPEALDIDNNSCVEGSVIGGLLGGKCDRWTAWHWTRSGTIQEGRPLGWSACWSCSRSDGRLSGRWWLLVLEYA